MVRKWGLRAVIAYFLFGAAMYVYLFFLADTSIPDIYKGTGVDPATFFNSRELLLSEEYSKIRNLMFFLATPYQWLFYYLILILGISAAFERWAGKTAKWIT